MDNFNSIVYILKKTNKFSDKALSGRLLDDHLILNLKNKSDQFQVYEKLDSYSILSKQIGISILKDTKMSLEKYNYAIFLYSNMPLITKNDLLNLISYITLNKIKTAKVGPALIINLKDYDHSPRPINLYHPSFFAVTNEKTYKEALLILNKLILNKLNKKGVKILDFHNLYIDSTVKIKKNVTIHPFNIIRGNSKIEENTVIEGGCIIDNCKIKKNCTITQSNLSNCEIGENVSVGPFTVLRDHSIIGSNCRIGDFVEIKKSVLCENVKAAHLSYIGNATVGKNTNVGCGSVFANYNGKIKQETIVEDNVFIGANVNLIAPLKISNNCYIAAGSTVTKNIPENSFVIAREREVIKPGYIMQ